VVEEPFEVRKVVGYMPDSFGLYDEIRVSEYLHFFASAYRIPLGGQERIVADLLELVDLSSKAGSLVDSLSRGMKQRLGLARALVHDPQVLILDEPASGLDPRARGELRELLLELRRMGKTILISSHILPELEEMCTHIGIIEAGRLLVAGVPSQILATAAQARPFRMRLVSSADDQKALELLAAAQEVSAPRCEGAECDFVLAGGDEVAAGLLARLIAAGVPVAGFGETQADLEDIFLKITKGVVQ
jgi:ABC-2 type transport system ATP-binding protein